MYGDNMKFTNNSFDNINGSSSTNGFFL